MNGRDTLLILSLYFNGDWDKIYNAITERFDPLPYIYLLKEKRKYSYMTILDDDYPFYLKKTVKPPFVIYYYGDISLIKKTERNIAVIGTRQPSEAGIIGTKKVVKELKNDDVIVSGLAEGVDAIAHQTAIDCGKRTIAVLGNGIDICFPPCNLLLYNEIKKNHLLISEYPGKVPPSKDSFPIRNRIVAGLCWGVVITEAKVRSGTMITANFAVECSREVMCLPSSNYGESGSNWLIKTGAIMVESGEEIDEVRSPIKTYPY